MKSLFLIVLVGWMCIGCESPKTAEQAPQKPIAQKKGKVNMSDTLVPHNISKVEDAIVLDGAGTEKDWGKATWRIMDQLMAGTMPSKEDFSGRYKLLWDKNMLYLLAEITDDVFMDVHKDGLDHYWDDDCIEIFIDQDRSKGDHQYNHNAFAYHVSLDDQVVDLGIDKSPRYFNDHLEISKTRNGNQIIWEVGIKVYSDTYEDEHPEASRVTLASKDNIGFMFGYCDNDTSKERESFVGDIFIKGEDKNRGWIDAGVFGQINLQ